MKSTGLLFLRENVRIAIGLSYYDRHQIAIISVIKLFLFFNGVSFVSNIFVPNYGPSLIVYGDKTFSQVWGIYRLLYSM